MQSLAQASMCWSNIAHAGVFDSEQVNLIGKDLMNYLRNSSVGSGDTTECQNNS